MATNIRFAAVFLVFFVWSVRVCIPTRSNRRLIHGWIFCRHHRSEIDSSLTAIHSPFGGADGMIQVRVPAVRVAPTIVGHLRRRHNLRPLQQQQLRWKRKDGHRYHLQNERPPTQKQRKQHNRRKNLGKQHGAPGSKAGPRRESKRRERHDILYPPPPAPAIEDHVYTADDALLDDLMGHTRRSQPHPVPAYYGQQQRKLMHRVVDRMEQLQRGSSSDHHEKIDTTIALPSDMDISLALRAFRDRHHNNNKVRALHTYCLMPYGT